MKFPVQIQLHLSMSKKAINGLEFLLKDHNVVRGIFNKIAHPNNLEPKVRHELTHSAIKEICQHAAVEEEVPLQNFIY